VIIDGSQLLLHGSVCLKGIVRPKMKITPCFTHPQPILGVYDFRFLDKQNQNYIKNILALPSFIMAVNGGRDFEG